jgi:hypothetical protein
MADELYRAVVHAECAVLKAAKEYWKARTDPAYPGGTDLILYTEDLLDTAIGNLVAAEKAYEEAGDA